MKNILINQNVSIVIDELSVINGFLYCLGIIIAIVVYTYGIKFCINLGKKSKILKGGYISLLLWENRVCIKNAKNKCISAENHQDLEKIYDDIFTCFKHYGFYVLNQSQLNREDTNFYFSNVWGPIFITFVTNFICELLGLGVNKFLYLTIAIVLTFIAMRSSIESDALSVQKDFLSGGELINTFYNKYPHFKNTSNFKLDYLSDTDKIFVKDNASKYLNIINKILKVEKNKHLSKINIDVFNFSQQQLREYYHLSMNEIEIYCEFQNLRFKHIENNKYD